MTVVGTALIAYIVIVALFCICVCIGLVISLSCFAIVTMLEYKCIERRSAFHLDPAVVPAGKSESESGEGDDSYEEEEETS